MQRAREEPAQPEPPRAARARAQRGAGPRVRRVRQAILREGGPRQARGQARQAGKSVMLAGGFVTNWVLNFAMCNQIITKVTRSLTNV